MSNGGTHEISIRGLRRDKEMREDLRIVYKATQDSRIDFRVRLWETIKTTILLSAGLFAVAGGIWSRDRVTPEVMIVFGGVLVILGLWLGIWTYTNVKREQSLQFHDEFTLYQIEMLLGLHQKIKEDSRWMRESNGWQTEAEHMFDWKHLFPSFGTAMQQNDPVERYAQHRLSQSGFIKSGLFNKSRFVKAIREFMSIKYIKPIKDIFLTGNALSLAFLIAFAMFSTGSLMFWEGYERSGNSTALAQAKISELSEIRRDIKEVQDVAKSLRAEINGLDDKIELQHSEVREVISRLDQQISISVQIRQRLATLEGKVAR